MAVDAPDGSGVVFRVGEEEAGLRLDVALAARPEVGSRGAAQRLVEAGRVTVDGRTRVKRHRLAAGEAVAVRLEEAAHGEEALPAAYRVAFSDEHLMVVDKPAGVVVHPAPGHHGPTLAQALAGEAAGGSEPGRAGIVHRLDRDTSGLLVVARSEPVHRALQAMMRARAVEREYRALVEGRPESAAGTIDAPLGRDRRRRTLQSTRTDRPREARTHFDTVERLPRTTLLRVRLDTGRTHQIRAHMTAIGHPVCGDRAYGGAAGGERLGLDRQFLHSHRLAFEHPITRRPVIVSSPLPADLEAALAAARAEDG